LKKLYNKISNTIHNRIATNQHNSIMERRISGKIDAYIIELKDALSSKIRELGTAASAAAASESSGCGIEHDNCVATAGTTINQLCKQLTTFVYEYEKLKLTKEDFMKRKRVKNTVPIQAVSYTHLRAHET
jgi:hypothetical protein